MGSWGHGPVGGSEGEDRGGGLISRGVKESETSTSRMLARERDNEGGGQALTNERSMIDTMVVELWIEAAGSVERASLENHSPEEGIAAKGSIQNSEEAQDQLRVRRLCERENEVAK